jgi:hypothetical protein
MINIPPHARFEVFVEVLSDRPLSDLTDACNTKFAIRQVIPCRKAQHHSSITGRDGRSRDIRPPFTHVHEYVHTEVQVKQIRRYGPVEGKMTANAREQRGE